MYDRLKGSMQQKAKVSLFPSHHPSWRGRAGGAQLAAAAPPSAFPSAACADLSYSLLQFQRKKLRVKGTMPYYRREPRITEK